MTQFTEKDKQDLFKYLEFVSQRLTAISRVMNIMLALVIISAILAILF